MVFEQKFLFQFIVMNIFFGMVQFYVFLFVDFIVVYEICSFFEYNKGEGIKEVVLFFDFT